MTARLVTWPGRLARLDWLWLAALGLLVQAYWAARLEHPTYMDAYYYATNGQRLAAGEGFTEIVIWQFLDGPAGLPAPSHSYWMPLPSLLAAAGYRLTDSFSGAQLPFWLLAGLLPLLAYAICRELGGQRWQAWTAGLFTAAGGFFSAYWNQPESFAPFAWAGGLCLLALAWTKTKPDPTRYWLLAGLSAGLAHLARADGLLFLALAISQIPNLPIAQSLNLPISPTRKLANSFLLLSAYLLVIGGWYARNWLVLGRPLSTVGAQTLFLTTYDDIFAYGRTLTLNDYLAWGLDNVLRSKMAAISVAGQTFIAVTGLIFLAPFILIAWASLARQRRKWPFIRPLTWYTLLLFATMSLLFTFPGMRGGLFHSAAALWPWFMALAPLGLGLTVDWAAARLPHWQPAKAKRIFAALFVAVAFMLSLAVGLNRPLGQEEAAAYRHLGAGLPPTAVVMAGNAPAFHYHTGLAAVSVPNEPADVVWQAARRYGVTHLLLDENYPPPLADLYLGRTQMPYLQLIDTFEGFRLYIFVDVAG